MTSRPSQTTSFLNSSELNSWLVRLGLESFYPGRNDALPLGPGPGHRLPELKLYLLDSDLLDL